MKIPQVVLLFVRAERESVDVWREEQAAEGRGLGGLREEGEG